MVIVIGTVLAAACNSDDGSEPSPSLPGPDVARLVAEAPGVSVNDDALDVGERRDVELDEKIVLGDDAFGLLQVWGLDFDLFLNTNMRLVSSERLEVGAFLDLGHLRVTLTENTDARVRLETASGVVLTTRQPDTEFTVCQSPEGGTCLQVEEGQVDWESEGQTTTYTRNQGTFAAAGSAPEPARCMSDEAFAEWFDAARRNETSEPLEARVDAALPCTGDPATERPDSSQSQLVSVPANMAWTDGGFDLHVGDLLAIEAGGAIAHAVGGTLVSPAGDTDTNVRTANLPGLNEVNHGALIGRIGDAGTPFFVGSTYRITIQNDGRLFLGINDIGLDNNSGEYVAEVSVTRP